MTIGKKIEKWCLDRFKNINNAAKAIDIPSATLYRYIDNENMPGSPFLIKILKLGCNLNWLLSEDETESASDSSVFKELNRIKEENKELRSLLEKIQRMTK